MSVLVACECGREFQTGAETIGRVVPCPGCGRDVVVPEPADLRDDDFAGLEPSATVTSGKAIASLVLGLCVCGLAITGLPAIILGCYALGDIKRGKGRVKGATMAGWGIAMGVLSTLMLPMLLLPATRAAREGARRSQCVNNLKQIVIAMHNYHDDWGCFPRAAITDQQGRPLLSWRVAILPYITAEPRYTEFHLDEPWNSPHNLALARETPPFYICPSDPVRKAGMTTYQVIVDPRSIFRPDFRPVTVAEITDGPSNTIMVGESRRAFPWTAPDDLTFDMTVPQSGLDSFHSHHSGGFNVAFADGSVRFLKPSIPPAVFAALVTRDGGEVISSESY